MSSEDFKTKGIATCHSHVFQRCLRGISPEKQFSRYLTDGKENFFTWRDQMFDLALTMTPERMADVSRFAYMELAKNGVTAVGEFQYIHHNKDGTPYGQRTLMSEVCIEAALEVGLRICLLRAVYERNDLNPLLDPAQKRFVDENIEDALKDIEALQTKYKDHPRVNVGIAPHSVRALGKGALKETIAFAKMQGIPVHMHLSEQVKENELCMAEHGCTPAQMAHGLGALDCNFTAIHGTHLTDGDMDLLARPNVQLCLSRSTERDLADGLPRVGEMLEAGVRFCVGVDGYTSSDPWGEVQAMVWDERSRTQKRFRGLDTKAMQTMLSTHGYRSLGMSPKEDLDQVAYTLDKESMRGVSKQERGLYLRGEYTKEVVVDGSVVIRDGRHAMEDQYRQRFMQLFC